MNLKELLKVISAVIDVANPINFWQVFVQLNSAVAQFRAQKKQAPTNLVQLNTTKATVETNRSQAIMALREVQAKLITVQDTKAYKKLNLDYLFGENATNLLYRLQTEIENNTESIANEFVSHSQKLAQFQQFANSGQSYLTNIGIDDFGDDFNRIMISYEGSVAIEDLKDLVKVSKDWSQIVNSYSRLTKDNNTDIKIISIERGSLLATLSLSSFIIFGIVKTADKVADVVGKYLDLEKKMLEIKKLQLENINAGIDLIDKTGRLNVTKEGSKIVELLMQEYGWSQDDELFQEVKKALATSVKKIIKFQSAGGKIDAVLNNPTSEQQAKITDVRIKNNSIQKAEMELSQLVERKNILQLEEGIGEKDEEDNSTENNNEEDE